MQVSGERSMNGSEGVNNKDLNSEFGFKDDSFEKSRLKGPKFWIIKQHSISK